ncbi:MAG TPA: 16S rRNA (cytosine(967)-C(5))-methyltransferase RsmB [Planktothrix sp.]|jgi:16S rRNA (cytosine967-C5)-methyltransferase
MAEEKQSGSKKEGLASRRLAVEVLIGIDQEGAYATQALNAAFKRKQLSERDRAFVTALVQGVLRHRMQIDEKLNAISSKPLDKMPAPLRNVLRIALFQLDEMPDIPASAVVNTSADLSRTMGHQGQAKFTNGILRNYLRKKEASAEGTVIDTISQPAVDDASAGAQVLATKYSIPEWIVSRWLDNFGRDETLQLLAHAQSTPELAVRVCEMSLTTDALKRIFADKDIKFHQGELVPSVLIIESRKHGSPEKWPGYVEGFFTVQDEAAAFVSRAVDAQPGELVVDLCAAPGGKTLHMAEMMNNTGRVIAVDKHEGRLNLLKQNRTRLALTNIEIVTADGRTFEPNKLADRVLLDAPCTGTGVMNRRSDSRFHREPPDLASLTELQRELLANAARMVKPGGILVYSTCSLEPEENFDNIRWFMREFAEFEGDDIANFLPEQFRDELCSSWSGPACKTEPEMTRPYMVQLMPSKHKVSGFFLCRLRKKQI